MAIGVVEAIYKLKDFWGGGRWKKHNEKLRSQGKHAEFCPDGGVPCPLFRICLSCEKILSNLQLENYWIVSVKILLVIRAIS